MQFDVFAVFLIVAVGAPAEAVALLSGGEALAVELHAFGVAAVAVLLFSGFICFLGRIHYFIFKFKLYPGNNHYQTQNGYFQPFLPHPTQMPTGSPTPASLAADLS